MTNPENPKDVRIIPTPYDAKDRRISRHGAMNTAVAIFAACAQEHKISDTLQNDDLKTLLTEWADWVLDYINEVPQK